MKYLCVFLFFSFSALFCLDLVPNAPVAITSGVVGAARVSVAGNSQGFMAVWTESNQIYYSVTIDNGDTWSSGQVLPISHATVYSVHIAGNESGFVITWVDESVGFSTGTVVLTHTSDMGATWSNETVFLTTVGSNPPSSVSATDSGFLASWWNSSGNTIQTSFSYDGINWSSPVDVNSGIHTPQVYPNSVGYWDNFLLTYQGASGFNLVGVSSFSSDRGATWSADSEISDSLGGGDVIYPGYYNNVFVVTWNDNNSGTAYSSTSTDQGSTWSTPIIITGSATNSGYTGVPILGTSKGFFIGVHLADNTGGVGYSTDNGQTWSSFTIVTGVSVMGNLSYAILSMANNNNGIMTAWTDSNSDVYSAFIPMQFAIPVVAPSNLKGIGKFNVFPGQKQIYNSLQWAPSTTQAVEGYKIYRDGEFLVTVKTSSYQDFTVKPNKTYEYVVIAYTGDSESDPVMVMVKTP